jgi:hypothetical protein
MSDWQLEKNTILGSLADKLGDTYERMEELEQENKALREMLKPHYSGWCIDDALAEMAASKNKVKSQGEG